MGILLCRKFLEMLNEIVENMVLNLQLNLEELEKTVLERVEKEIGERAEKQVDAMQRKMAKLERETLRLLEKENYNNNLIYHLRLNSTSFTIKISMSITSSESAYSSQMVLEGQAITIRLARRKEGRGRTRWCPSPTPNCYTCRRTAVGASPSVEERSGNGHRDGIASATSRPESLLSLISAHHHISIHSLLLFAFILCACPLPLIIIY